MSESPVIEESLLNEENSEQVTETSETAFSRFGAAATRRSYGYSVAMTKDTASPPLGNVLKSKDLLNVEMTQEDYSPSLFDMNDDETPSNNACLLMNSDDEDNDNDKGTAKDKEMDSDDEEVNGDESGDEDAQPQEAPAKRGRTKKSFHSVLETTGETPTPDNDAMADAPAANQVQEDSSDEEEEDDVDDDATVEFTASDEKEMKDVEETSINKVSEDKSSGDASGPLASTESAAEAETATNTETLETDPTTTEISEEEKRQPDKDSLITSIDNLFVHADKQTVTVRDVVRSLEAEYDTKFEKPTKQMIKGHLVALVKGHVEPSVEPEEPPSESEEEKEASDAGEDFDSDSSEEEEEVKKAPKKKRNKKPTKRISPRQKPSKKKPSHVRIHAEMLRKRRIEELRVRNEELQIKQSKEDQKRAEQIAAKFETDTDELRLKRLEDRLDLLQKLDQKRIRVISDEARSETKVEKVEDVASPTNDDQALSCAPTEDSDDSDDDFELEIVGSKNEAAPKTLLNVPPPGAPVVIKSSALSVLDMVGSLKPSDKKNKKRTDVVFLSADQPQASPGRSMSARAALRNSLRAKQRKGANMWLARELGYKTEEEHMRDCVLVEQKKREDVVKREEERLKANERKQLRERMLVESDPYGEADDDEEEEYNPNEADEPVNGDGNESDEEMAMARQIEEEQGIEGSTEESPEGKAVSYEDHNTDPPVDKDQESPQLEQDLDESKAGHEKEVSPSVEDVAPTDADNESPGLLSKSVEAKSEEVDTDDTVTEGATMEANPKPSDSTSQNEDEIVSNGDKSETSAMPEAADSEDEKPLTSDAVQGEDANEFEQTSDVEQGDEEADEKGKEAPKDRNAGWKAMLQKEAEKLKKQKAKKNGKGLVEAEADEEEEEEVAGLEDFGFSLGNKKKDDDDAEEADAKLTEEDLKHVVDDVSDDEGDEEAGAAARKELEQREEKERHKEIIRRMREGYDGRRGGIAGGGVGARGMHRFDQLVAADNREDAKRLGLLNDDELDSDDEAKGDGNGDDDEDDENALLDKMLKDRFLHRSSVEEVEENFSSDEEEEEEVNEDKDENADDDDEKEQERLAKRFTRRARMQRCIETHGDDEEFSQLRLIDEDENTKLELKMMKSVSRKSRETSKGSSSRSVSQSSDSREGPPVFGVMAKRSSSLALGTSSLSLALQASRVSKKKKTSFLGGSGASKEISSSIHKCVSMGHVVFNTGGDSQLSNGGQTSHRSNLPSSNKGKRKRAQQSTSLWSKVSANGFKRRRS